LLRLLAGLSPRLRQAVHSLALALLIAAIASAAIELTRWHPRSKSAVSPTAQKGLTPSFAHDQRLMPMPPEPALPEANQTRSTPPLPVKSAAVPGAPGTSKFKSASDLFADAKQARVQGNVEQAIAISEQLEKTFPNSTEGITTHLSLGVLYQGQGKAALALQEFKLYRHIGSSALMAEALWGEEQTSAQLGRSSEERPVLEELLQNYPRSVYTAAAEKRLAALNNR
jgi:TolA-binding protein